MMAVPQPVKLKQVGSVIMQFLTIVHVYLNYFKLFFIAICGDGILVGAEACDDNNQN